VTGIKLGDSNSGGERRKEKEGKEKTSDGEINKRKKRTKEGMKRRMKQEQV
jgi:hypothetical protein